MNHRPVLGRLLGLFVIAGLLLAGRAPGSDSAASAPAPRVQQPSATDPPFEGYRRTQQALWLYQDLASKDDGEQLPVPKKPLKAGGLYPGIPRLVRLLSLVGDLPRDAAFDSSQQIYGGALVAAIERFQRRHGLDITGRLDAPTVRQLNVPLSARVEQLRLTLERWRSIPDEFRRPAIVINIPEFVLRAWNEQSRTELEMKVIVGKAYRHRTPIFTGEMTHVVFRPYWNVPWSIQRAELVPKIRKDPAYLAKNNMEIVNRSAQVVSSGPVDSDMLQQLRSGQLSIRQRPGPKNSLGLVKFVFPNEYNVYLHGTPETALFGRSRRDLSHGCIRVQDPLGLAMWVLRNNPEWTKDSILAAMNGERTAGVNLESPIPVLVFYGTAVVLEDGEVRFFEDIYKHDAELKEALAKGNPYPGQN